MNIVLLGKPGVGKGTVCQMLKEKGYTILPTGDLLREEIKKGTEVGKQIEALFKEGKFAPVEVTNQLVKNFLKEHSNENVVLDAYPRNLVQYNVSKGQFDKFIFLDCPDSVIRERLEFRQIHEASGRTYNSKFLPPKVKGLDDETGEPLINRADDTLETINKRLKIYYDDTFPIVDLLKKDMPSITIDTEKNSLTKTIENIICFCSPKLETTKKPKMG